MFEESATEIPSATKYHSFQGFWDSGLFYLGARRTLMFIAVNEQHAKSAPSFLCCVHGVVEKTHAKQSSRSRLRGGARTPLHDKSFVKNDPEIRLQRDVYCSCCWHPSSRKP